MESILRRIKRRLLFVLARFTIWFDVHHSGVESRSFVCNICANHCRVPLSVMTRESVSCYRCGSTIRHRSVINALLAGLSIGPTPLPFVRIRKDIAGLGMTDSGAYAKRLERTFSYQNTFYHKEPRLDILNVGQNGENCADFIICSDVLEHVRPPVSSAFQNLYRLLRPGGVLVITVPLVEDVHAIEHFPSLCEYHFEFRNNKQVLVNRTVAGSYEEFDGLVFHGGEGETLEMRVFSREWLSSELTNAGFAGTKIMDDEYADFGILWGEDRSVPVLAWKQPGR